MGNQLLVSIVIPLYNCEDYIKETIQSVIQQSYENWELIVVDDKSTDNSAIIVESIMESDNRIKLVKLKNNEGAARARNRGIKIAKGDYLAFLDSDDLWTNKKLERHIKFMEEKKALFSFTGFIRDYYDGKTRQFQVPEKVNYKSVLRKNPVCNSSVVINISEVGKVYYPDIRKRQDYALWLYLLREKTHYGFGLNEVLTKRNVRESSVSSNKFGLIKYHWVLYRKHEGFSTIKSSMLIIKDIALKVLKIK